MGSLSQCILKFQSDYSMAGMNLFGLFETVDGPPPAQMINFGMS